MLKVVSLLSLVLAVSMSEARELRTGFALGMESRLQREVNPDYAQPKFMGQLHAQVRLFPYTLVLEGGQEERETSSGAFKIRSESLSAAAWGRFGFSEEARLSPFLTTGLGMYFDRVTSEYFAARDESSGTRTFWGAGAGLSAVYFENFLLEAEGRLALAQDRSDPQMSLVVRAGLVL